MKCPKCKKRMYPASVYIQVCPYCGQKLDLRKGEKGERDWVGIKELLKEENDE